MVKSDFGEVVNSPHYKVSCELLLAFSCADLMTVTACNLMAALTAFCVKVKVADQNFAGSYRGLIAGFFARNFRTPVREAITRIFD